VSAITLADAVRDDDAFCRFLDELGLRVRYHGQPGSEPPWTRLRLAILSRVSGEPAPPGPGNWTLMQNEVHGLHLYDEANGLMLPLGHLTPHEAEVVRDALNGVAPPEAREALKAARASLEDKLRLFYPAQEYDVRELAGAIEDFVVALSRSLAGGTRPRIVCLCGSTRFYREFQEANYRETMAGRIVLSVGFYPHSATEAHGEGVGATPEQKAALDELHLRKIDLADEVLVLNVGGYIGDSTRREIAHAAEHGKPIRYVEPVGTVARSLAGGER